ncbi:MAG TPA: adenylate/guanylate cyclase domain-containing protein [Candidatus Sulfotelmatobacter sp.]|jgi:adenylate cyclase|nr:adenylate/guanylate cyclase domain-containing protein [Candidatus Sulfotelmatobacter sp.]
MAAPSGNWWTRRGGSAIYALLVSWWRHRASFLISLGITLGALTLYYFTFFGEHATPVFDFLQRLEYNSLDTRFRYRPQNATPIDPHIVIVDIDQHSQEVLGKWPFSRTYFAKLLHVLHEDDAKVAAFDITFSKPDQSAAPVRALWGELEARQKRGEPVDPKLVEEVKKLAASYDADKHLAGGIREFGPVVLGNYFLYTEADLHNVDQKTLDAYAEQLSFFSFPQVRVAERRSAFGKQDYANLIAKYERFHLLPQGAEANMDSLTGALGGDLSGVGFFNAPPDTDGVVRRATLVLPFGRSKDAHDWDLYGSLDVMAIRAYLGLGANNLVLSYDENGIVAIEFGESRRTVPSDIGQVLINYHGGAYTYPHYSMADVLNGTIPVAALKGKIVLIGASATGIGDLKSTPYGGTDYPGVEIHANVIDNILHNNFLVRGAKQQLLDALLIVTFGIPLGIALALVAPRWMWFGIALLPPLVAVDYAAFLHGWWLNFTIPAMTLTGNVVLVSLYRALIEEKEKRRVRSAFGQYLSPEVIRRLLLNPQLVEPRKTEISVMFSDIRGFTTISEKLDAQDLAHFLNLYLSDMTRIVFDRQGTLDKYIGDAVMAFWGAPFEESGHAERACNSALDMMKRMRELQKQWEAEGKPRLDIGIGLNTGVASVGNMGSSLRYGYTALGDTVNLSSRLEGLNKDYATHILANESTYKSAMDSGFIFRELDLIRVKGKLQPVTIYELIGRAGDFSADSKDLLSRFAAARSLYQSRHWEKAQNAFQTILEKWPGDGPSRTYWKRCQEYLFDEPPLNWDGVFTMDHK